MKQVSFLGLKEQIWRDISDLSQLISSAFISSLHSGMFNLVALLKWDYSDWLLLSIPPQPVWLHWNNDISDKLETSSEKELPD